VNKNMRVILYAAFYVSFFIVGFFFLRRDEVVSLDFFFIGMFVLAVLCSLLSSALTEKVLKHFER
jgi:hypothetical protein